MTPKVSLVPSGEEALRKENETLRLRLEEAEQTLNAIQQGGVDAFVVAGPQGQNVFTLVGSEHNYRLLIESIGEGALTASLDGSILYCNSKFAEMVKEPTETIVGRKITDFVEPLERVEFSAFLNAQGKKHGKRETLLLQKGGGKLSTQVSVGFLDTEGLTGLSIIVTDLTDTKMAASLLKLNEELKDKATDLSRSNTELERFAYVASHDLKEPLRIVTIHLQFVQKLLGTALEPKIGEHMNFVMEAAGRMYDLIDDLLGYARIGVSKEPAVEVDCDRALSEAILSLRPSILEAQAEIIRKPLPHIQAIHSQMVQVFQNLLGNAIKFRGSAAPQIHISAESTAQEDIFSVKDNGIGISPLYFTKIFEVFQRLHDAGDYPGTGIGLAICKKIIEQHAGTIWVESQPNQGANFRFSFPKKASLHS